MYWNGYRLSVEVFLGTFHCILRARRVDECGSTTWDDLWRSQVNPPGDIEEPDQIGWVLSTIGQDLMCLEHENGPS